MSSLELYPSHLNPDSSGWSKKLHAVVFKTAQDIFLDGILDQSGALLDPNNISASYVNVGDQTIVLLSPTNISFGIDQNTTNGHIVIQTHDKTTFDYMDIGITHLQDDNSLETKRGVSVVAHRSGASHLVTEMLNMVERLDASGRQFLWPGVFGEIVVVCVGCSGEAGSHKTPVYGWNIGNVDEELTKKSAKRVQWKQISEVRTPFSHS